MSSTHFIQNFVFLLGGLTQHAGEDTGMMRLWAELFRWRDRRTDTRTMIMPREWNDDVASMAAMVHRHGEQTPARPRIMVVGYSYGGGWTAPRLVRSFERAGRSVDLLVLIDPVWRARLLPLKMLSLTGGVPITIPANVLRVLAWRQSGGGPFAPKGSRLRLADSTRSRVLGEFDWSSRSLTHHTIQYEPTILIEVFTRIINMIETSA